MLRIDRAYEVRGQLEAITSYSATGGGAGNVVNEVKLAYNEFDQPETEYQAHAGVVDDVPAGGVSPNVQYAHTDGSSNHVRLTGVTYPNGRMLHHAYSGTDDDNLSRVSYLSDVDANGVRLAEYSGTDPDTGTFSRLGLSGIIRIDFGRTGSDPVFRYNLAHGASFEVALVRAPVWFSRALLCNLVLWRARGAHQSFELFQACWCLTPIGQSC